MMFSRTELLVLGQVGSGNKKVLEIASALKLSVSQVYRIAQRLRSKRILIEKIRVFESGKLNPSKKTHVSLLLQVLASHRNLFKHFSGVGLKIYGAILEPRTLKEIQAITDFHKTTIYNKLRQGFVIGLAVHRDSTYMFNDRLWSKAKEFLVALREYEASLDDRVPVSSTIYYKNKKEIVFSVREELDASVTAFSAYEKFGIKLFNITNFYYFPKKRLTKKEVFLHSLYVTKKEPDIKHKIFVALFYLKHKHSLLKIQHEIIANINKVLAHYKVKDYPSLQEIRDRAEVYDIKV